MKPAAPQRPVVLVVLTGGGFTFETSCILQAIGPDASFVYLATEFGGQPGSGGIPSGPRHAVPSFESKTRPSKWRSLWAFVATFYATLRVVRSDGVEAILSVGCSHSVPMLLAGRVLRCQTIYIESITRVDRLSATGKIVHNLRLAGTFIVQWPGLQKLYPTAQLGTIL